MQTELKALSDLDKNRIYRTRFATDKENGCISMYNANNKYVLSDFFPTFEMFQLQRRFIQHLALDHLQNPKRTATCKQIQRH